PTTAPRTSRIAATLLLCAKLKSLWRIFGAAWLRRALGDRMSAGFRVLITDRAWPDCSIEREVLGPIGAEIVEAPPLADEDVLISLAADADAIGVCWAPVTARVIQASPRCRVISRFGVGLDNIAVDEATRRKIPVTYVPDYCVHEVADHTLALLLACARNIAWFHTRTKQGEYALGRAPAMRRLSGRVLGLVGLGRIGRAVALRARACGMHVIANTHSGRTDFAVGEIVSFEELLERSDFVSLHAPLTPYTRHLFRVPQFERMQRSAFLINTSRGALIETAALETALEQGLIAGAALDVYDPEPPDLSQPLYRHERLIATPHAAFYSVDAVVELRQRAARQIVDVLAGRRPEHVVNPQVFEGP
ncbi:MAG TPA: C-terminal binding protein, partial [Planctomycetaceae bacterium]|nr:C-terminal binding protein [Planctomycetaceae bacterium]